MDLMALNKHLKVSASAIYRKAINSGTLKHPDICERCGADYSECYRKLHGHHPDYAKPLEVIWLCAQCHVKEHGPDIGAAVSAARDRSRAWEWANQEQIEVCYHQNVTFDPEVPDFSNRDELTIQRLGTCDDCKVRVCEKYMRLAIEELKPVGHES
jgi:hypothetical protein